MVNATVGGEQEHYGSFFAETEYENKALSLSANILFLATEKVNFSLSGSFMDSKGVMQIIGMSDVPQEVTDNVGAADYDYGSIYQYSDLDYTQLNVTFGTEYSISERISWTLDAAYYDLTDNMEDYEGYVYGIETGSLYVIRSGVRIGF